MTTLVTGAAGFIGGRLSSLLIEECKLVRRMVRDPRGGSDVKGDLLDPASLGAACQSIECVFHCAGYAHASGGPSGHAERHWRVNYEGTCNLLNAAGKAGVRRFVFLSSVKAMAEPGEARGDEDWPGEAATPYGMAKRAAETAVLDAGGRFGMHVVNLRLAMVYGSGGRGNLERMARGIRAGWFPPLPETGNRRSLVHVDDVIAAVQLAADTPRANGRTYIVADDEAYSGREIYDTIRGALGRPPAQWRIPAGALRAAGRLGDWFETASRKRLPLNSEVVDRLLGSAWYSPARIERELGWRARTGLADGVREMLGEPPLAPAVV